MSIWTLCISLSRLRRPKQCHNIRYDIMTNSCCPLPTLRSGNIGQIDCSDPKCAAQPPTFWPVSLFLLSKYNNKLDGTT